MRIDKRIEIWSLFDTGYYSGTKLQPDKFKATYKYRTDIEEDEFTSLFILGIEPEKTTPTVLASYYDLPKSECTIEPTMSTVIELLNTTKVVDMFAIVVNYQFLDECYFLSSILDISQINRGVKATASDFVCPGLNVPVAAEATDIESTSFTANWNATTGATGYYLDVATDLEFTEFLTGYEDKDVGNVLTVEDIPIESKTCYFYRVRAYSTEFISMYSNTIHVPDRNTLVSNYAMVAYRVPPTIFTGTSIMKSTSLTERVAIHGLDPFPSKWSFMFTYQGGALARSVTEYFLVGYKGDTANYFEIFTADGYGHKLIIKINGTAYYSTLTMPHNADTTVRDILITYDHTIPECKVYNLGLSIPAHTDNPTTDVPTSMDYGLMLFYANGISYNGTKYSDVAFFNGIVSVADALLLASDKNTAIDSATKLLHAPCTDTTSITAVSYGYPLKNLAIE